MAARKTFGHRPPSIWFGVPVVLGGPIASSRPTPAKKITFSFNNFYFFVTIPYVFSRYNCREEFQIHDELLKANYTVGRISEATPEHYLVQVGIAVPGPPPAARARIRLHLFLTPQGKYFMVRDVHGKLDVLNTTGSCGAPNFRQAKGGYAVFGMGQPSLNGFRLVLQKLQREGHKVGFAQNQSVSAFICGTGAVGSWKYRVMEK